MCGTAERKWCIAAARHGASSQTAGTMAGCKLPKIRTAGGTWSARSGFMNPDKPTRRDANQGEGDRVSARKYNQQVREFAQGGKVEPAALSAEAYVEHDPEDAARAERIARRGPLHARGAAGHASLTRSVVARLRPIVDRAVGKLRARLVRK